MKKQGKKTTSILILGAQASGKGTQARLLAEKFNFAYFSMGEISRAARDRDDKIGKKAKNFYDKGKLYPEIFTKKLAYNTLATLNLEKGIVFEGYPRTKNQINDFQFLLKKFNISFPIIIYLKITKNTVLKRIAGRKVCEVCYKPYLKTDKNHHEGKCLCGGKLITRPDDRPSAISKRLKIFFEQTIPLLHHLKKIAPVITINGEPKISTVNKAVLEKLNKMKFPYVSRG